MKIVKLSKCLICKKLIEKDNYYPFCSKRCSDIDLSKWLTEGYYISEDHND